MPEKSKHKSFAEASLLLLKQSIFMLILAWKWTKTELDVELQSLKLVKNKQETRKILTKTHKGNKINKENNQLNMTK